MVRVIRWANPGRLAPNFAGIVLFSIVLFFNVISILIALAGTVINPSNVMSINITTILIIIAINYFILMNEGKSEAIILFFDNKFKSKKQNKSKIILITTYIFLSIAIVCYFATVSRNNMIGHR